MNTKIYIDFEMNKKGLGPSEIIAIGAVKVVDNKVVDTFYTLAGLERSDEIHIDIVMLTGISNFTIKDAPSFHLAWRRFSEWAGGSYIYCWGYYDKECLYYTWRINRHKSSELSEFPMGRFCDKMIDIEKVYQLNKGPYKESLSRILKKWNTGIVINKGLLHNPVYDATLLWELHRCLMEM